MLQAELCYIPCIESVGQNLSKEIDLCHVDSWVILTRSSGPGTVVVVGWLVPRRLLDDPHAVQWQ